MYGYDQVTNIYITLGLLTTLSIVGNIFHCDKE